MRFLIILIIPTIFLSCSSNRNKSDRVINYYPDGKVEEIKYFKDSMLNDECYWFYPNGRLEQKVSYRNNVVEGHVYFFYESGVLKSHKFYINGKPFGYSSTYFDDTMSIIKQIMIFNLDGKVTYKKDFDSLGNVISVEGKAF